MSADVAIVGSARVGDLDPLDAAELSDRYSSSSSVLRQLSRHRHDTVLTKIELACGMLHRGDARDFLAEWFACTARAYEDEAQWSGDDEI